MLSVFPVSSGAVTVEMHLGFAEQAVIDKVEPILQHRMHIGPLFKNGKRARHQPAAIGSRRQRLLSKAFAIGRVGEEEMERLDGTGKTEISRIAAEDTRPAGQAERFDICA